jgi:hypothetical protein
MTQRLCKYCLIAGLFLFPVFLEAQTDSGNYSGWRVYQTEGEIALTIRGNRTVYRNGSPESQGIVLNSRDMIQVSSGRAEIQLASSASASRGDYTVIKLSENTSLLVDSLENGEVSLELLYGRLRAVNGTASPSLTIRSGNSSVTIREADAAVDYVTRPGITQPILTIHCFKGQGELVPLVQARDSAELPVRAGETLTLEYRVPFSYVERKALDVQALSYWEKNQFSSSAPLAMPITDLHQASQETDLGESEDSSYELPVLDARGRTRKNGYIVTGLIFFAAGAVLQGHGHLGSHNTTTKDILFYGGYGVMGLGTAFLLSATIYNPQK